MRSRVWERCRDRLERLSRSGLDSDTLRFEAIDMLRQAIGFAMWGFPLVDPDSLIPYRPLVSDPPPWGSRLPDRWILDQSTREINSRSALARSRDHVGVLSAATGGDLARCYRWRELGQPIGMGDELRAAIADDQGCWGSFELFRSGDDRPFDRDDASLVREAVRLLTRTLRQVSVRTAENVNEAPAQAGVLVMGDDLLPRGATDSAAAWLGQVGASTHTEPTRFPIVVYGTVGRLMAAEAGEEAKRAARVRLRANNGQWAVIEAARLVPGNDIAVTIRAARPGEVLDLLARAHGLTRRERELVELVTAGLNTRQIAARLFISSYTAKDHLKSVFEKMGVHSRGELVGELVGLAD